MYEVKLCIGQYCKKEGFKQLLQEFERVLNIKLGQTTDDGKFKLETVDCIGSCRQAHDLSINGNIHIDVEVEDVEKLIDSYRLI